MREVARSGICMDTPYLHQKSKRIYATRFELAEALGVRPETICRWTSAKKIPVIRLGRLVRYDLAAITQHLAQANQVSTLKSKGGKK